MVLGAGKSVTGRPLSQELQVFLAGSTSELRQTVCGV